MMELEALSPEVVKSFGAVCLSPCMEKVLMVQLKEQGLQWTFPHRADTKAVGKESAAHVVQCRIMQGLVGLNLQDRTFLSNYIEVRE